MRRSCAGWQRAAMASVLGLVCLSAAGAARAQTAGGPPAISSFQDVTWHLLASAPFAHTYNTVQYRTVLDGTSTISLRERLEVFGNGTTGRISLDDPDGDDGDEDDDDEEDEDDDEEEDV